jgi:alkyl sulfatase BDS1-like metallo-beta-lactamase superfamily hydrolase
MSPPLLSDERRARARRASESAQRRALAAVGEQVRKRDDRQLARVERGMPRKVLLATIFAGMRRRFDPQAAAGVDTVIEWRIRGAGGAPDDGYEVVVRDGRGRVRRGGGDKPAVTFTIGAADLLRLATGATPWQRMLADGSLQIAGDPFVALRLPKLFRLGAG